MTCVFDVLEGFVRCISHVFRVKDRLVVLIKITDSSDCYCSRKANHILVRWNETEEEEDLSYKEARLNFLNGFALNRWIRASGLLKHKVYSRQSRERIVWLFQPLISLVEATSQPEHPRFCVSSPCFSRPLGMLSVFHGFVQSVHCKGRILELTVTKPVARPSDCTSNDPVYWCLSSCLLNVDYVSPGSQLVLHNIWYLPINSSMHKSVDYEAILILGIYSTCEFIHFGGVQPHQTLTDQCSGRCCTDSRLVEPESLFPINVRAILSLCLMTQSSICSPIENSSSNESVISSKRFKNAILDKLASPDPSYRPQFTEEFINFPFLYEKHQSSCSPGCFSLTLSHFLEAFSTPTTTAAETTSREIRLELPACQSQLICTKRTKWKLCELVDYSQWFWCFEDTVSKLENIDSADSTFWYFKSLRICPETTKSVVHSQSVAIPLLIGQLCWNADDACYYLAEVPESSMQPLFPTPYSVSSHSTQKASISLVLKRGPTFRNRKPLPGDQTIVALVGAMLICESPHTNENVEQRHMCNSIQDTRSLCITADQVIAMKPDSKAHLLHRFETLSVKDSIKQDTIMLTRLGTASQTISPDTRLARRWCYPVSGVPIIESNKTTQSFHFTGLLARRWYLALEQGVTYRFLWQSFEVQNSQHLLSVQQICERDPLKCDHLLDPQDALALGQFTQKNPHDCTVTTVHVQALLLHKIKTIRDWCLWCGGQVSLLPSGAFTAVESFDGQINHVIQIHIPFELDWTQWCMGFPGPLTTIRAYDLHWVRLGPSPGSVQLVASALSRIELATFRPVELDLPLIDWPHISQLNQRNCAKCRSLWTSTQKDVFTPGWIGIPIANSSNLADCNIPVHHISVRACIVKCLEFQCYNLDPFAPVKVTNDCSTSNLCFYMRFLISDGSGRALVQLGRPPSTLQNTSVTKPAVIFSDVNPSPSDEVDLVRRLLGMDQVNWRRLCQTLALELSRGMCKATCLSVNLKSTSQESSSPLQAALRSLLASPTFLRVHIFWLSHVPSPWKSTGGLWRLRQTRIQAIRADGTPGESALVNFAVSPPRFFTLINLRAAF